jgi:type IV pilus assembly protein PilC
MPKKVFNNRALSRFFDDLATMQNSGLTIERALGILKKGKPHVMFRILDDLQHFVGRGSLFWEALSQYPDNFDEFQVMSIRAGEDSGTMVETCKGLANYFEMRHQQKRKLLSSLIYPILLLHAVIVLPPLKYLVVNNLERSYWSVVLPVLLTAYAVSGICIWCWRNFLSKGSMRETIDEIILKIPVFGKLARSMSMVRVMRSLSGLHNAGIGSAMSASQAIKTSGNLSINFKLKGALPVLEHGGSFTDFFSFAGVLSHTELGIIAVAEETGTISDSLNRMVLRMEEETSTRLISAIKAMGYIVYLIATVAVAITVISFYSGYFNIA